MSWKALEEANPELAAFGLRRFNLGIAYLGTVTRDGSPRVHPVTPIIGRGRLFIFMEPTSPKGHDLRRGSRYALHIKLNRRSSHYKCDNCYPHNSCWCIILLLMDEIALMNGVRHLDPQALSETHNRYYPAIFRYIAFKVGNHETAEDLTSEVFVRLLNAAQKCNAPNKTLLGWLYCVASRLVNDYYRKQYRSKQEVAFSHSITSGGSDPAEELIKNQTLEALREAISELTDDQQHVLALRFGCEMPIKEVAEVIGRSEGAVKQLQARAVAAVTKRMSLQSAI